MSSEHIVSVSYMIFSLNRYTILAFSTSFVLTWVLFAFIWWAIAYFHGDLEEENLPGLIDFYRTEP